MKICKRCKIEKNLNDFYKYPRMADGLRSECKKCNIELALIWKKNNVEKYKNICEKYYKKHKKKLNVKRRDYKKTPAVGERWNAVMYVQRHKKKGDLIPDKECPACNSKNRQLVSFFKDLSDRSNILWICRRCLHQYRKGESKRSWVIKRKIDRLLKELPDEM